MNRDEFVKYNVSESNDSEDSEIDLRRNILNDIDEMYGNGSTKNDNANENDHSTNINQVVVYIC